MLFRKKVRASDLGATLAALALQLNEMEQEHIAAVAQASRLDPAKVQLEYQYLKIYWLEAAISSAPDGTATALRFYKDRLAEWIRERRMPMDLGMPYAQRSRHYAAAYNDPRKVGFGISMASALSESCGVEDVTPELMSLFLVVKSFGVEAFKYVGSQRVVEA